MNGKYYDKEKESFVDNPYIALLTNEKKIKLFFRDEWYDLVIKKVEESKKNYAYTYTATDLFINELGKNGFKVELDEELENSQGTATELGSQVLDGTDWIVAPTKTKDEAVAALEPYSDLLVETNLDTLYKAYLCKDILVKVSADGWLPIREDEVEPSFTAKEDDKTTTEIKKGEQVYLFYSDLIAKNTEPMILYRKPIDGKEVYVANDNEDIIINSYNFRVTRENKVTYNDNDIPLPNFIVYDEYMPKKLSGNSEEGIYFVSSDEQGKIIYTKERPKDYHGEEYLKQEEGKWGITLEDRFRGYKTVRKPKTAYDRVTDKFITYFLERLYTQDYKITEDTIPYSNKAYFTKVNNSYNRFFGYTFDSETDYYEQVYTEFLKDDKELDDKTQYYVRSKVPEYVPTMDESLKFFITHTYIEGKTYYYYNEKTRNYCQLSFSNKEEFDSFEKDIYCRENKNYYLYKDGKYEIYNPTKRYINFGSLFKSGNNYYRIPSNLAIFEQVTIDSSTAFNPAVVDEDELYNNLSKYYAKSFSSITLTSSSQFLYEQSGKMIDGFIKYEDSVWSSIKGYKESEYLSPTLVQNFLVNSLEITSLDSGWLFDGAPSSEDRAGELGSRLDDPTLEDNDENMTSSMFILHLTDSPVYYASQTGNYLYTNYDFQPVNPSITLKDFYSIKNDLYFKELADNNTDQSSKSFCIKTESGLYTSIKTIYYVEKDTEINDNNAKQAIYFPNDGKEYKYYIKSNDTYESIEYVEANSFIPGQTYYFKNGKNYEPTPSFANKWEFFQYTKQLYFKAPFEEETFYDFMGYTKNTPIYAFSRVPSDEKEPMAGKAYYLWRQDLSTINNTPFTKYFQVYNTITFEGGVNQYFTYNEDTDTYTKVEYSEDPVEGQVYYEFKPSGKMHYLPYDYYKDIWESAAIRDYLDNIFPPPGYEAYIPFNKIPLLKVDTGKTYWKKNSDGTYKQLDDFDLSNYKEDYLYEKWDDDAIEELKTIFNFEYKEDQLTEYAKSLLELVSELLDWTDYEKESKIELLNGIDLFGIRRQILLSKMRRLEKNYPDVEGYQKEKFLEYLGLLNRDLNQNLRMEMSVISDPNVVNYVPTKDTSRKLGKNYYIFETQLHTEGEVSATYMAVPYTGETFTKVQINEEEYIISVDPTDIGVNNKSMQEAIIYEFNGELPALLRDIQDGIELIQDSQKKESLKEIENYLNTIRYESSWSYLDPLKLYKGYQALLKIKEYLKDNTLQKEENKKNEEIYKTILDFYQLFITGKTNIGTGIYQTLGIVSNDAIPFLIQSLFSRAKINESVEETIAALNTWIKQYKEGVETKYVIYEDYSAEEIYNYIKSNNIETIIAYTLKIEYKSNTDNPTSFTSSDNLNEIVLKKTDTLESIKEKGNIFYVGSTKTVSEQEHYNNLLKTLQTYSEQSGSYLLIDTDNIDPDPTKTYYQKIGVIEIVNGEEKVVSYHYVKKKGLTEWIHYRYEIKGSTDLTEQFSTEYYEYQPNFINYSKNVEFNKNLSAAIRNLEQVISLKYDDKEELKTGNKAFDELTEAMTGFSIIWHLEKQEREQIVDGTKLLINLAKRLTALQISEDFIELGTDRRQEGHKRRALNTGFAANRSVIKKLNRGEEYVLAFSLGQYREGIDEPPTYTKKSSINYGDVKNKYYYFDNNADGVGDYALGTDDYKEIFSSENDFNTPYGWMEFESQYELAAENDTTNPLYFCIAQEFMNGKYSVRFVPIKSNEVNKSFYYPDDNGDYMCIKTLSGAKSYYDINENRSLIKELFKKVLTKKGNWEWLIKAKKNEEKEEDIEVDKIARFRLSPTYICGSAKTGTNDSIDNQELYAYPNTSELFYTKLTDKQISVGPVKGVNYYKYENGKYILISSIDKFEQNVSYYVLGANYAQFKRSTNSIEGRYKLNIATDIKDYQSDVDFYRVLSLAERAAGPQRDTKYYTYDNTEKVYKDVGEISSFDNDITYYLSTYERKHFSLYSADDQLPDLYYFYPDNNGDYVHIIRKEEVEEINVKWYQFWINSNNVNKIYREFKDSDDLFTDAPHYYKRYNSAMDYEYHPTTWKDGHIGPWREKYQRYSKVRIHVYDNTSLDENYIYWVSNPFSDGSECYTLYTGTQVKRYTLYKRYLGLSNGVQQYQTLEDIKAKIDSPTEGTVNRNVSDIIFTAPEGNKDGQYKTGSFILKTGISLTPVKIANRAFRPYEIENDSQRVPYVMIKQKQNIAPTPGIDWIYCQSQNGADVGYYRAATVDDQNLYTNWQIKEGVDEAFGLYKFLRVKDPINWNSDSPPFTFATPVEVSMLSHTMAMRVIKSLNTPYWWGRRRSYTFSSWKNESDSFEKLINFLRDLWERGNKALPHTWKFISRADSADEFTKGLEKLQDKGDDLQNAIADKIRALGKILDLSENDEISKKIFNWIDNRGIDINSDDPNYRLVNYTEPVDGLIYYTKQKIDGKWVYVPWEETNEEGARKFEEGVSYFTLSTDDKPSEFLFKDPNGETIGIGSYSRGNPSIFYHYFPEYLNKFYAKIEQVDGNWVYVNGREKVGDEAAKTSDGELIRSFVNIKLGKNAKGELEGILEKRVVGDYINYNTLTASELEIVNNISGIEWFAYVTDSEVDSDNTDLSNMRTQENRQQFWDAMYHLYGTQWSNIVDRVTFASGTAAFLNTKEHFTDDVLNELYSFSELWVKEVRNGFAKFIPFDLTIHSAKTKYYRHTYSGEIKDAVDGITDIFYEDNGQYKYYAGKESGGNILPINYDGLKVSFCEYDYNAGLFKIDPVLSEDSFETNMDYSNYHTTYLDFDCSQPIEGYFDLLISPEVQEDLEGEIITPAVKERYIWWKAPVKNNYNLTYDLYNRVGTLFYSDSKSIKDYPIIGVQLFKYKVYKSNNYETLLDYKKAFYEYEINHVDTYEPTFEEYKTLKRAFQGYFGIPEWNKVEAAMDLDYTGKQKDTNTYKSYLDMLTAYLTENYETFDYIKDRITYMPSTGEYSFNFKHSLPLMPYRKISLDNVEIELNYYASDSNLEKTVSVENAVGLNKYEQYWAPKDLVVPVYDFKNVPDIYFNTLVKNLAYKYSLYKVSGEERPDDSDVYYKMNDNNDDLIAINGLETFPENTDLYKPRILKETKIEEPKYTFEKAENPFNDSGEPIDGLWYIGYNKIENHDSMFDFVKVDNTFDSNINYYYKDRGLWKLEDSETPRGNLAYFIWNTNNLYLNNGGLYEEVVNDSTYSSKNQYYTHPELEQAEEPTSLEYLEYGQIYPYPNKYEHLTNISSDTFYTLKEKGILYRINSAYQKISNEVAQELFITNPTSLYYRDLTINNQVQVKLDENYDENKSYYTRRYNYIVPSSFSSSSLYAIPVVDSPNIKNLFTRKITLPVTIKSSSGTGVKANLKVTYQIIDGINAKILYKPETYNNITLYPNANEGYLARKIEEWAYIFRKETKGKDKILTPNPFKLYVCDGIESELIGINAIEENKTYEAVVRLDSRILSGHHNISEDYNEDDLNGLSSFNNAISNWIDTQLEKHKLHYKKMNESLNNFGDAIKAKPKGEKSQENSVNESSQLINGAKATNKTIASSDINGTIYSPTISNVTVNPQIFKDIVIEADKQIGDKLITIKDKIEDTSNSLSERVRRNFEDNINIATKLINEIITFGKPASKLIGLKNKKTSTQSGKIALFANETTEGQQKTTISDPNDKAVSLAVSEKIISELKQSLVSATLEAATTAAANDAAMILYMSQLSEYIYEVAQFILNLQQLGCYDFLSDYNYLSNSDTFYSTFEERYSNPEFINRILTRLYEQTVNDKYIMALPGEIPDNNDIILTNYYLYNPVGIGQDDIDTLVFDYVGTRALDYYEYDYDNLCQKVRGIEIKEKNYLSALQQINEKFECWTKYEFQHYTAEDNDTLDVNNFQSAHTPGETKMTNRVAWVAEDDFTDISFDPINDFNTHISTKQDDILSALISFNPRVYWFDKIKEEGYIKVDIHEFQPNVDYYIVTPTGVMKKTNESIPDGGTDYYIKKTGEKTQLVKDYETNPEKYNSLPNKNYIKKYLRVPIKIVSFKQFTGDLNYAGFKYGINLKSIKRTLDSKELVSRLIVKENTNTHALDGFCTIQRASENPTKENFILNFDYYVQHKMLERETLWNDLYNPQTGYYAQIAIINKDLDHLVSEIAEVNECLDRINANYETYSLARDSAQQEIDKMATTLAESLPDGVPSPWKYNMSKETEILRTSWSDTQTKQFTTKDKDGNIIEMTEYVIEGQTRAIEIPKFNADTQKKLQEMDIFQKNYLKYQGLAAKAKQQKEEYENKLKELYALSDTMYRKKDNLNLIFFKKYYRYIQEGSWKDDSYMDDTLYYLDALATARASAFPKVTYDIQTIDLQNFDEFKGYNFNIGDKTYIEDTEFFGYTQTGKPYQEETIITKIEYNLDDCSKNKITVQNYKTQFEDLFQRIAATVSKVELGTGAYNRANSVINETGIGATIGNQAYFNDGTIISSELGNSSNKIKIANGAIYRSNDGGETYEKIISAEQGIDPALLGNGKIDLTSLVIGSKEAPQLSLTENGLTAYKKNSNSIDYSTFVRFDDYGVYGIKNYKRNSSTDNSENATLNDIFIPNNIDSIYENASFGLTWDGFFLKTGDGSGRVTIGTDQDLRMSTKKDGSMWLDRIIIGKIEDEGADPYYGFRIIDDSGNVVLNTDDRGQLYLRHKLYISHFNDEYGVVSNDEGTMIDSLLDQTNVTLGIVKAYKRTKDGYEDGEDIFDNYSSLDYLTKVFSVKSAVNKYKLSDELVQSENGQKRFEQFTEDDIKKLIESEENLAIFDNGNLYAKNAWIEGTVSATDGVFNGTIYATGGRIGRGTNYISINENGIKQSDGKWNINYDGTAQFENVTVNGKISSAIFEYGKVSTLGGLLFVRPSYKVIESEVTKPKKSESEEPKSEGSNEATTLTLTLDVKDGEKIQGFEKDGWCQLNSDNTNFRFKIINVDYNNKKLILNVTGRDIPETIDSVISIMNPNGDNFALGLNSTNLDGFLPKQAFSLIEYKVKDETIVSENRLILGNLNQIEEGNGYGLYADNVILRGKLTTGIEDYEAGITTTNMPVYNGKNLVFYAGKKENSGEQSYNFFVSNEGYLFAKQGRFEGEVVSSTIKTSVIIGTNEDENGYGLTIKPEDPKADKPTTKAILFADNSGKEYFKLNSNDADFFINTYFGYTKETKKDEEIIKTTETIMGINKNGVSSNAYDGIGLFCTEEGDQNKKGDLFNYLFSLTKNNDAININYKGTPVLTITEKGIVNQTQGSSGWGEHIKCEGTTNGCDIYFI